MQETIIPLNKMKIFLLFLGSIFMIGSGIVLFLNPETNNLIPSYIISLISVLCIIFFGIGLIYALVKLFDPQPGLVINEKGIHDNSSFIAAGLIEWNDIDDISFLDFGFQKIITVKVKDPAKFIDRATGLKRRLIDINSRNYGSPVQLSTVILKIDDSSLFELIQRYLYNYNKKIQNSNFNKINT